MAIKMTRIASDYKNFGWYEYSATFTVGTSEAIYAPEPQGLNDLILYLIIHSGSAKIQLTMSPLSSVIAGGGNWWDWANGNITSDAGDIFYNVTAFRVVVNSGSATIEARLI